MRTMLWIEKKNKSERQTERECAREGQSNGKKAKWGEQEKLKIFAKKARSGRTRKRVIKFHKNPLLAMLTYSVCRFSSAVRERNALTARQSPKNLGYPLVLPMLLLPHCDCCTCSFLWHSFRFDWEAIQLLLLFAALLAATTYYSYCGMWPKSCHAQLENVAYISYFCSTLCLSLPCLCCRCAPVADSSTRRSTITGTTIKTKYNK